MEKVTNKKGEVTAQEKRFIFNYLNEGDMPVSKRTVSKKDRTLHISEDIGNYIGNVVQIVESFLDYGFLPAQVKE